ncbi:DoxX family protein [uncultured Sphingomonas sp.]|uniref:DoxX family protein n=1 Tax=uncultured Sphingomonas sp. TaxID=158754 RepID=UPI0025CCBF06|nr:DoxX family protein [uncultured Sphingomonas sp.]
MTTHTASAPRTRMGLRILLTALYAVAGAMHLLRPHGFEQIVPGWVPWPHQTVLVTGVAELLGAVGLWIAPLRWWAALGLAAYAVAVYPANIKHAVDHVVISGVALDWRYHVPRLLLQPLLVWAALFAGGVTDWPWRRRH